MGEAKQPILRTSHCFVIEPACLQAVFDGGILAASDARAYNGPLSQGKAAMKRIADERVLVLDFGSQYAQLIARRVREQQVYCEIVRHDLRAERIRELAPMGIILSGGPSSVYEPGAPKCDPDIFRLGVPVMGIC